MGKSEYNTRIYLNELIDNKQIFFCSIHDNNLQYICTKKIAPFQTNVRMSEGIRNLHLNSKLIEAIKLNIYNTFV